MSNILKPRTRRAVGMALFRGLNVVSVISLVFYTSLMGILLAPHIASAAATWTTTNSCGEPQNINHYQIGDHIFINGSGFDSAQSYPWDITGQPGGASGDPNIAVASGTFSSVNPDGTFCFDAYTVATDDWGTYQTKFAGVKGDNYRVDGVSVGSLTITKIVDSGPASADDFSFTISPDPQSVGSIQTINGTYTFAGLPADSYTISESPKDGYHQVSSTCTNVAVAAGQTATCEIHNARDTGSLIVHKGIDSNGDGTYEGNDTEANAIFQWGLDAETPGRNFGTTASGIPTGLHTVTENTLPNYQFTGWYFGGEGDSNLCGNRELKFSGSTLPADVSIGNNETTVITLCNSYIQTPPDVSISKTDNDETANPGDTQTYVITITNDGDQTAFGVKVTDTLPTHVASVSAISDGGSQIGNTIVWNSLTVPGHGTKQVSFDATLDNSFPVGTTILTNTAELGCGAILDGALHDVVAGCLYEGTATDTTSVTVAPALTPPALTIAKTDNQTTATAGQVLTYQISVTNSGDTAATNVKVTDTLPSFITTVNAISDSGSQVGTAINWSNLTIAGHSTKVLTFNATVDPNLGVDSYVLHNVATLGCGSPVAVIALVPCTYSGTATDDTSVTVAGAPILAIEKSANVSLANPGNTIVYTVKVSNTGTAAATNVILTDILPTGFTTLDSGANTLVVNLGTIAAGANVTTTYQTVSSTTLPSGVYTNVVTASASNATSVSASANVTLLVPEVLGAEAPTPEVLGAESLPETGTGMIDYIVALFGIMALGLGLRLTRPIKQ